MPEGRAPETAPKARQTNAGRPPAARSSAEAPGDFRVPRIDDSHQEIVATPLERGRTRDLRTDAAIAIVDEDRSPRSFALNARAHAKPLGSAGGGELADILESPDIVEIMDRYESFDRSAVRCQNHFRRLYGLSLTAIALLMYLSLAALALPLTEDLQRTAHYWALAVAYIGMLVAFSAMTWLHFSRPNVVWRDARAVAEVERGRLFCAVMDAQPHTPALLPLRLEYVRRYQLDLQEDYYERRGAQHETKLRRGFRNKLVFFLVALLAPAAMAATQFLDKGENGVTAVNENFQSLLLSSEVAYTDLFLLLMALGVAIWWAVSQTLSQIGNVARNAALFAVARKKLAVLRETKLEKARSAAAHGADVEVRAFLDHLQSILTAEHQAWIAQDNAHPAQIGGRFI